MQLDNCASTNSAPFNVATLGTEAQGIAEEHTDGNRDVVELLRARSAEASLTLTTPVNATADADES